MVIEIGVEVVRMREDGRVRVDWSYGWSEMGSEMGSGMSEEGRE
jgi:hypothetical protein